MPKQLADEQIRGVIESLRQQQKRVTGIAVRTELRRLFGTPGGVDRIYKLINYPPSTEIVGKSGDEVVSLREQLALAVQRAELAEHREQAHQEKWAMEIDQLRQQLRAAQIDSRKLSEAQNQVLELRRELHRLTSG
jgi:DNA repair exonuclease SbcCD ATPase subunit